MNFYRPQRSCEGYVFTGVCLSTGEGGWWCVCLSACWDTTPPHPGADTPQSRHPPEQTPPKADTPPEADPPRADPLEQTPPWSRHPPRADTPQEQTPPKSRHPQSRYPPEQTPPRSRDPPRADTPQRYGDYCGRCASYWNAFLFVEDVVVFLILNEKRKAKQGFAYFTVKFTLTEPDSDSSPIHYYFQCRN